MPKFRKGDRIRVITETWDGGPLIGDEGIIKFVTSPADGMYPIVAVIEGKERGLHFSEIEKVASAAIVGR